MSEVSKRLDSISSKLHRISEQLDTLKRENEALKAQKAALELKLEEDRRKMASLTQEYNHVKLAKSLVSTSSDRTEMKFKVNELVREIDKCIALLNR